MMKAVFFLLLSVISPVISLYAQESTGGHRGNITALLHNGGKVISAGEDGFIVTWDINSRRAIERFQLTTCKIEALVSHPIKDEICVVEAESINNYRITVWDYAQKSKIFSVNSNNPVTYINYSAGGSLIIACGINGSPLSLLDSETGEKIEVPEISGSISLAATGRAETNVLLYQAEYEGQILYMDLTNGSVTDSFQTTRGLSSPIIFGSNRFIAGINSAGLQLVDAVSGTALDSVANIERSALLCHSADGFCCLSRRNNANVLYRFTVDRNGRLVKAQELSLNINSTESINAIAHNNGNLVFGSSQGILLLLAQNNRIIPLTTYSNQVSITEIAAGKTSVAFLTEGGSLYFIPADYRLIQRNVTLETTNRSGYTKITSLSEADDQFILWQSANTTLPPLLAKAGQTQAEPMNYLLGRFPLRAVSSYNSRILTLDSAGNLSVRNTGNTSARADFTFSSAGAIDAAFVNNDYLALCRSVTRGSSSFLFVNYRTGETVPVFYPAQTGLTIFRGGSGNVYAETIEQDEDGTKTTLIDLLAARESGGKTTARIFQYGGETHFSAAESGGNLALANGNEGIILFTNERIIFQRTNGLPVKLLGNGGFFISLDSEGNIAWYNNRNGETLAVFSLHTNKWELTTGSETISGQIRSRE